ncbi:MAG: MoxR family ATPase [Planctomycetota bacterium]
MPRRVIAKWRPPLALVLGGTLAAVFLLPVVGIAYFRVAGGVLGWAETSWMIVCMAFAATVILGALLWRFNAAHSGDENAGDPRKFIHYRALGQAILETLEPEVRKDAGAAVGMGETRRNVVLIDEVDKAPRDFPNDLLGELSGRLKFTVPELQSKTFVADQQLSPIVIITSNSEKNLPDPFLRRCAYYHIEFPSDETLRRIVGARVEHPNLAETRLVTSAISAFQILRKRFSRKMSTAELIDWVRVLVAFDANPNQTVQQQSSLCGQTISSLAKTQIERKRALEMLQSWERDGE